MALPGPHPGQVRPGQTWWPAGPSSVPAGLTRVQRGSRKQTPSPSCLLLLLSKPHDFTPQGLREGHFDPWNAPFRPWASSVWGPDPRRCIFWSWAPVRRRPGEAILAWTCHLNVLRIPTHRDMQPLQFNKKHTNYKSYLPSQINHGPWRVYARTPDFSS